MYISRLLPLSAIALGLSLLSAPASALTMAECSVKYNASKDAGTLGGLNWNQFRKQNCGSEAAAAPAPTAPAKPAASASEDDGKGLSSKECSVKYQSAKDANALNGMNWNQFRKAECGPGASTSVSAPAAAPVKPAASASDDDGKGLSSKECSVKYQSAKDANALNGMNWNQFRKAECGPGASATAVAPAAVAPAAPAASAAAGGDGKGLSMKECSVRYNKAKDGNALNGMNWNQFRKAECGPGASDDDSVPDLNQATYNADPEKPTIVAPRGVTFPTVVSPKFSSENPGKARMHTCLEQYYANKDAGTLNGMRWIQKGGGYYSLCNARLKNES